MKKALYWIMLITLSLSLNFIEPNQNCYAQKMQPQTSQVSKIESRQETNNFGNSTLTSPLVVFSNLVALIIVMFLLAWLYKKFNNSRLVKSLSGNKSSKRDVINILSTSSLGQGKYLHVVEVGKDKILIGSTASNITMLKELKEDIYYERVDFNE